jgi:hypothetical protein
MRFEKPDEGWTPIFFVVLVIFALFFTLISLMSYENAKDDYYSPRCSASNTYPVCISDLSQMSLSETMSVIGFSLTALGLYLIRRAKTRSSQPSFYIFGAFMRMLCLFAVYLFL